MINEIFRFSSCRGIKPHNISSNFLFHNIKEILFFLDLINGKIKNNYIKNSLLENEEMYNFSEIVETLNNCSFIYIEISTLKYLKDKYGNIGHDIYIKNMVKEGKIEENYFKEYIYTEEELLNDINTLESKLNHCTIIYTGHITVKLNINNRDYLLSKVERACETNLKQIEDKFYKIMSKRNEINKFIKKYCKYYIIIEDIFKDYKCEEYLLDTVHFTDKGHSIKLLYLTNFIKKITI